MDGGAWWAAVHGVAKSRTRLSDFTFTFHFPALEKEMATHSSDLAWRIPGRGSLVGCRLWVAQNQTRLKRLSCSSSNVSWILAALNRRGVLSKRLDLRFPQSKPLRCISDVIWFIKMLFIAHPFTEQYAFMLSKSKNMGMA